MDNAATLGILRQLERGEISAREADARLTASSPIERVAAPPFDALTPPAWARGLWNWLIVGGIALVCLGAWIIAATLHTNAFFWLLFGVPFVLSGSLLLAVGASGMTGHWIYLNVESARKRRRAFRLAFPLPRGLLRLGLWLAQRVPARVRVNAAPCDALWDDPDELVRAFERELNEGRGIAIEVGEQDSRVQVYIV